MTFLGILGVIGDDVRGVRALAGKGGKSFLKRNLRIRREIYMI
jgi:hypothetical protein